MAVRDGAARSGGDAVFDPVGADLVIVLIDQQFLRQDVAQLDGLFLFQDPGVQALVDLVIDGVVRIFFALMKVDRNVFSKVL